MHTYGQAILLKSSQDLFFPPRLICAPFLLLAYKRQYTLYGEYKKRTYDIYIYTTKGTIR